MSDPNNPHSDAANVPPNVHWAVLWVLNILLAAAVFAMALPPSSDSNIMARVFGVFGWIVGPFWLLRQAAFIRKLTGQRGPITLGSLAAGVLALAFILLKVSILSHFGEQEHWQAQYNLQRLSAMMLFASLVLYYIACFRVKMAVQDYYGGQLSDIGGFILFVGPKFLFGAIWLQYYFSLIATNKITKQTGYLNLP